MNKFSIIVPVYNVDKYLKDCLDSILKQNYQNYEVIIVCDKCTDNSEIIVDEYVKKYNNFTKIYKEKTGLGEARNIGVTAATGDYLLFLDSDDYFEETILNTLNEELINKPDILRFQVQDIISGKVVKHNEKTFDTVTGNEAFNMIFRYHYIENSWCYAYNRLFWEKNKFKFMPNCIAEDYGLTPLIISKAKTVKSISYIGYNYRYRENSLMNNSDYEMRLKKMLDMLKQYDYQVKELEKIEHNPKIIEFLNNSLIYYSTTLNYKDFCKYNRILRKKKCYSHLVGETFKGKVKNMFIKMNAYLFYRYMVK